MVGGMAACVLLAFSGPAVLAESRAPEILALFPAVVPKAREWRSAAKNLAGVSAVLFGATQTVFDVVSPQKVVAIVPHRVSTSIVTVNTPHGRSRSPLAFVVCNDPRIPDEVSYKAGL